MATATDPIGTLLVMCGPSGVGKSTLARRLTEKLKLRYIVSATTRPRRPNEHAGKLYDHVSNEEFTRRLEAGEFLEYAEVYNNYYGTPKHPTLDHIANGEDVLLEIDVQGAFQLRYHYPQALMIFILPPDQETLLQRLRQRGRDSEADIQNRFRLAKREIWMAKGSRAFDDMVYNDDIDGAVREIERLIQQKKTPGGI